MERATARRRWNQWLTAVALEAKTPRFTPGEMTTAIAMTTTRMLGARLRRKNPAAKRGMPASITLREPKRSMR